MSTDQIKVSKERWLCSDDRGWVTEEAVHRILAGSLEDNSEAFLYREDVPYKIPGQPTRAKITVTIKFIKEEPC
jgi:hypothetical protein